MSEITSNNAAMSLMATVAYPIISEFGKTALLKAGQLLLALSMPNLASGSRPRPVEDKTLIIEDFKSRLKDALNLHTDDDRHTIPTLLQDLFMSGLDHQSIKTVLSVQTKNGVTVAHLVATKGHPETWKQLDQYGVENTIGTLFIANQQAFMTPLAMLYQNPQVNDYNILLPLIERSTPEQLKKKIIAGNDALSMAVKSLHYEGVKAILDKIPGEEQSDYINSLEKYGTSLLHHLCTELKENKLKQKEAEKIAFLLVEKGLNIGAKTDFEKATKMAQLERSTLSLQALGSKEAYQHNKKTAIQYCRSFGLNGFAGYLTKLKNEQIKCEPT